MQRNALTRRRAILTGAGIAAGTLSSIALTSDNATATASVTGDFTVPDGKKVLTDQTLEDVTLTAAVDWSFQANAKIHGIEIELHVGASPSTLDLIARHENHELGTTSLTGTEELSGSIVGASDYSIENFTPTDGELNTSVIAELRFYAIRDENVVAEARHTASFTVTTRNEELTVEMGVNATGEVGFKTN